MTSTLPVELQLRIIDLALPPRMSANFPDRRDLLFSFSLVHRSWTAHARGLLEEQVRFDVKQWTGHHVAVVLFRQTLPARRLKRMDVRLAHRLKVLTEELEEELRTQLEAIEVLSFARSADLCPSCNYKLLYETNDWHARNAVPSLHFLSSGAFPFLRFLSISHMTLPSGWHNAAMPFLHTLLLLDVGPRSVFDDLHSLRSLRVLGAKAHIGNLVREMKGACPRLQHIALIGLPIEGYVDLATDHALLHTLSSITILHLPVTEDHLCAWPGRLDQITDEFEARWVRPGLEVRRRECVKFAEISGFDLEEWALSVGGT